MPQNRRSFLKSSVLSSLGLGLTPGVLARALADPGRLTANSFVGIQMGPHSILDEGIEPVLDFLKEEAAMNAVVLYSHTYYDAGRKPLRVMAKDHGKPPLDLRTLNPRKSWVNHNERFFQDTVLRHRPADASFDFHDRDLFAEVRGPASERDMKLYFRILETRADNGRLYIDNFDRVVVEDIYGNPGNWPCWNKPDYRNWVYGTVEDIFTNYDVDGLQYGAERAGPLSDIWFNGVVPNCFCSDCRARNEGKGIDSGRALEGYRKLHTLMQEVEAGTYDGPETVMISLWAIMQRYPEVLAWNYEYYQADEDIQREVYNRAKAIKPDAVVGRHVDHQRSSWDPFYRSAVSYEEMADYADFIKPILYHDVYGPRLRYWVMERWQQRAFRDFSLEQTLDYFYTMMGYSPAAQVPLDALEEEGMGPAYVYDETKRCVDGVNGKTDVVAGIGIDVLWHGGEQQPFPSDPTRLQRSVYKAVEAGAAGLLASREYDEMRHSSLRAFGDAVRQLLE